MKHAEQVATIRRSFYIWRNLAFICFVVGLVAYFVSPPTLVGFWLLAVICFQLMVGIQSNGISLRLDLIQNRLNSLEKKLE